MGNYTKLSTFMKFPDQNQTHDFRSKPCQFSIYLAPRPFADLRIYSIALKETGNLPKILVSFWDVTL